MDSLSGYEQRKQLAAAYKRADGHIAFIDESYRKDRAYLMTAVTVDPDEVASLRNDLDEITGGEFHATDLARRGQGGRDVVRSVAELVAQRQDLGIVVVRVKPADKDAEMEASRAACFRMLARKLSELRDPEVALVVYDRRRVNEDKRDRATIKAMRQDGIVREKMSVLSATAGGERLLASADVVSFAVHRALNENDREFFDLVKGSTTFLSARTNTYIPNTHMSVNAITALDIHALSRQQSAHGATAEMAEKKDNPGVDR